MNTEEPVGVAAKLIYVGMSGPEDPTRACMPFALAVATVDAGMGAIVHLRGEGVTLLRDRVARSVVPIDLPPLCDVFRQVRAHAIPVYV
jgi:predicted peroxiredoxin